MSSAAKTGSQGHIRIESLRCYHWFKLSRLGSGIHADSGLLGSLWFDVSVSHCSFKSDLISNALDNLLASFNQKKGPSIFHTTCNWVTHLTKLLQKC